MKFATNMCNLCIENREKNCSTCNEREKKQQKFHVFQKMFSLSFRPLKFDFERRKKVSTKTLFFFVKKPKNNKNCSPQSPARLYLFQTTWSAAPLTFLFSLRFLLSFRSFARMLWNRWDARGHRTTAFLSENVKFENIARCIWLRRTVREWVKRVIRVIKFHA